MYHTEKIGVFISHIMGDYQQNLCQGIIDKALEYGYGVDIFTTLDGENLGDYGIGEESILHLCDYTEYCGILFASDTYPCTELKDHICRSLSGDCSCPIIEIAASDCHFPSVSMDNNSMTAELVTHLATVHHYRRICYLGCDSQRYFSDCRMEHYRKAMEAAHLSVGTHDICACEIDENAVADAFSFFLQDGQAPDAVVCYNDAMALMLMHAATRAGYRIPDDIAITGCDHTADGQNAVPSLTTVTFPVYELGACAVNTLFQKIRGDAVSSATQVTASVVYADSCGCEGHGSGDVLSFQQSLKNRIASLETSILESMRMSASASHVTDLDDGMDLIAHYIRGIEHCREFYLCLYEDWNSLSQPVRELTAQDTGITESKGEILLCLAMRDGKRLPSCSFKRSLTHTLLPEHICRQSDSAYIYTPLFFEEKEFGYVALAYEDNRIDYHFQLVHWFLNINQMLHNICETECSDLLFHHLEDVYTKDSLTGLYNRHGYRRQAESLLANAISENECITCFLFDLDGLKKINDTYGHAEGDFALQVIGQALAHVATEKDVCAHFSGDEFYLVSRGRTQKDADDLLAHVNQYMINYNRLSAREYDISASGGYALAPAGKILCLEDLDALFAEADRQMYRRKHAKKNA